MRTLLVLALQGWLSWGIGWCLGRFKLVPDCLAAPACLAVGLVVYFLTRGFV